MYAPWGNEQLSNAWLGEYAIANAMRIPFAPNPFISQVIAEHSLRGRATDEQLLQYIEDIRKESAKAMNVYEALNIYDLEVPAIFGAVLRQSNEPSDLIRVAAQMKDEAKAFRSWCRNLDSKKDSDPKGYIEQLEFAKNSLKKMGKAIEMNDVERMQVSLSGGSINLPSPILTKLINYLNVDIRFIRPRSYLLNVLSGTLQLKRLSDEVSRVFRVDKELSRSATEHLLQIAKK